MKQLQQLALFTLSFFFLQNLMAQTAEEIIAKNIDAIGGKNKITSITSVKMDNTIQVMGNEAPSSSVLLVGKGVRAESEVNGQKMIQVVTDKGGWSISPMNGSNEAKPIPDDIYKTLK